MIDANIIDGSGKGHSLGVGSDGEIGVVVHPHPPDDLKADTIPFRQYFTDNGFSSGSNNMLVNGSVVEKYFYVKAASDHNIYIKNLSILIADAGASLRRFGNIAALTKGIRFDWITDDVGTVEIHEGLKTNFDFVRMALGNPAFGTGNSSFRANNVTGGSEAFFMNVDFSNTFGMTWGIKLRKNSNDKLMMTIRDNVSTIDEFNMVSYGIKS